MAGSITIGRHGYHLERLGRFAGVPLRATLVCLVLASCSGKSAPKVRADLAAYVPASAKVTASSDRTSATGRSASITETVIGSVTDYLAVFKAAARKQGFEEQVDQGDATNRVVAYRASGDRTLTLQLTAESTGSTAVIVLLTP
jgi:hypothetical protein